MLPLISIHIFKSRLSPKLCQSFPPFFTRIFPVQAPTSGDRLGRCIQNGNFFSVFYTKIFPVSDTLFSPFPIPFLTPFLITYIPDSNTLLSPFQIPFYLLIPFLSQFPKGPIPFLSQFLFLPFPVPFLPPPPLPPCAHVWCHVPNVRIPHSKA